MAAARVGGIHANNTQRAEFIYQNLMIHANIIHAAYRTGVQKLLCFGSSCMYPKAAPQPLKEEYLLTGKLEPTNEPYAVAKIAAIEMCAAYNHQYGTNYLCVTPANLYGPGDNYDPQSGHVIAALLRKAHEAAVGNQPDIVIWGTGTQRREFLYSEDFADACIFLMERANAAEIGSFINIGTGSDHSIREIAERICAVTGFRGSLRFDTTRPDGAARRLLDNSRITELGWTAKIDLREGLGRTYRDFLDRYRPSAGK